MSRSVDSCPGTREGEQESPWEDRGRWRILLLHQHNTITLLLSLPLTTSALP